GLFGTRRAEGKITLLIEAGDREDEFVLRWAKKLNPLAVYQAFESLGKRPEVGQWSEFGTKKVYETTQLATTANRQLVATASGYVGCVFDVAGNKQLLCRPIPSRSAYSSVVGVAISSDGGRLAFVSGHDSPPRYLTILDGPNWKRQRDVPLPAQPLSLRCAPCGSWFAVGSTDKLIRVYDSEGKLVATLEGHAYWPRDLSVTSSGSHLAAVDEKSGLRVWDTSTWSPVRHIEDAKGTGVDFDPSSFSVATVRRWGRATKDPNGE